jgi:4-carboxymuconolactone decarboxylase
MKSRIGLPLDDQLSAEQRTLRDSILASRGNLDGPFIPWLMSPEFGDLAQRLGAFCRYHTQLTLQESELLILCVAARFQCIGEQQIHEPIAKRQGISQEMIDALRERRMPPLPPGRLEMLHALARSLLDTNRIDQMLYDRSIQMLGTQAIVEVVGILGYYALAAFTLNAFDMSNAEN